METNNKINASKVSIPKPCSYGWDKMALTKDLKGRHCAACNKIVVDFTVMSTDQIMRFLSENQGVRTCGYIKTLETTAPKWFQKPLLILYNRAETRGSHKFVRIAFLLILSGMLYLSGCTATTAGDIAPMPQANDTL